MIDSSGRRFLRADGTLIDVLPVGYGLVTLGGLLIALFVLMEPAASTGLGTVGRLVFWTLHIGTGLGALWLASIGLRRRRWWPASPALAVLLTGLVAIAVATPVYLLLDGLFAGWIVDDDPEPAAGSVPAALFFEAAELGPWFLVTWFTVNLPLLLPRPAVEVDMDDTSRPALVTTQASPHDRLAERRFLSSLPGYVGTDLVAVSSDLHYLNVWTVAGRTTVLGRLRDVAEELGDRGSLVHRSHWVAHAHVRRILGTATDAACILSNGLRVPISRRRWKAVRDRFGRGVVHRVDPSDNDH